MRFVIYYYLTSILISSFPFFFYFIYLIKRRFFHLFPSLIFTSNFWCYIFFLLITYIFYFLFSSLFLFFNTWRFSKFFNKLGHAVYLKKLSIYFAFWAYLQIYMWKTIYVYIYSFSYFLYNRVIFVYNIILFKIIMRNYMYIFLVKYTYNFFLNIYNCYIILKKIWFNLKFMEYIELLFLFINKNKDLNRIYLEDPALNRNSFFKWYTDIHKYIYVIIQSKYYIRIKRIFILTLFFILDKFIKYFILKFLNNSVNVKLLFYFIMTLYNNKLKIKLKLMKENIINLILFLYFLLLNIIYNVLMIFIYIIYSLIIFLKSFINKYFFIIKFIVLFIFLFNFYWIINYLLLLLYKHYMLYFPLFSVKETFHSLNFEWIDMRNYFGLIKLHNTLIDINIFNNFIYNNVINQLNLKLNKFNFKFSSNLNINLFLDENIRTVKASQETLLLNDIFEKWNKYHGAKFIRRWRKYKRMLNWSLRNTYKGKMWYRAIRKEKMKSSVLSNFNSGRYYENTKNEISNNLGSWDNLHQLKKLPYTKEIKLQFQKTQAWYTYFKKRHSSKKRPRYLFSYYIKLKNIPFSYIYREFNTRFLVNYKIKKFKQTLAEFEQYYNKIKVVEKRLCSLNKLFINSFFKKKKAEEKIFFFKKYFRDFIDERYNFVLKNNIPTRIVTELRTHRLPPGLLTETNNNDHVSIALIDEMHQYVYYKNLSRKGSLKNVFFRMAYLDKKYPYKINRRKYYQYVIKNYLNILDTGIKISKKFYFFERSKLNNFNRASHRLLSKIDVVYVNQLLKYKYWEKVFFLHRLNKKNMDFWGFFDYLKVNKYNNNDENDNFTLYYLNRWKKDYYHLRIYLLRVISFLYYFNHYKKVKTNSSSYAILNWIRNVNVNTKNIDLENLSTLNSIKFFEKMKKVNIDNNVFSQDNSQDQDQMSENLFNHFKLRWHFKELLNPNPTGNNPFGNRDKFMYIINLFFKKFNKYFIEYDKINKYNSRYHYKVKSYKIKVLRKIKNLNKFFYYNTKRNKGTRLFSFLNTFSIQFHIKHLLWHSPYFHFLFKKNNVLINNNLLSKNWFFYYKYIEVQYNIINYSVIFNLLLNIIDIREEWAFYLTDDGNYSLNYNLLNLTFYYCYNYGNFFFLYLNELDIFRIFSSLLKNYYNNFLIKLVRYRYFWEEKDYNILSVIIRYLKHWYRSSYLKIRYFVYQTHETYVKYLKRKFLHFLRKKYWIRNRVDCLPLWFILDYYIKCFIKYLFNKYFTSYNFSIWWLNYRLNYSFLFFIWLNIQKYKYFSILYLNKLYFWVLIKNVINDIMINYYYILLNNTSFIIWYWILLTNNYIYTIYKEHNVKVLFFLYKIVWFNYIYYIRLNIIDIFNFNINYNSLLYSKFNIEYSLKYFVEYLQNIKNKMIYFKSNNYYFKKQKLLKKRKRKVPLFSFLSTNLKRNWFSLRNRSSNFFLYSNLYLLNYNKLLLNKNDITLYHFYLIMVNNLPLIKNKSFNILFLIIFYYIYVLFFVNIFKFKRKCISKGYDILNFDVKIKKKKLTNVFNHLYKFNKKAMFIHKFFLFNSCKYLNVLSVLYEKKYFWFRKFFNLKRKLDFLSVDQFSKNIPIYKDFDRTTSFIHIDSFNKKIKNFLRFFLTRKMPFINLLNDYLVFNEFNLKKKDIFLKYQNLSDNININLFFLYWIIIIPYFFFQYILIKYHLKIYIKVKRRISYLFRSYFDNLNIFVKINKYIGRAFFKSMYRTKRWKDVERVFLFRKRTKKHHYSTLFQRYRNLYYRLSPLGPYYFWFSKINLVQYSLSYKNYFFKTIINSYYFCWWVFVYLISFLVIRKNYMKFIKRK